MSKLSPRPRGGAVLDDLAHRLRQMVRDVHARELPGVERFRVLNVTPLRIGQVQGELALEDGDPDFTVGEGVHAQLNAGVVAVGDLIWVNRCDGEWHAFDTVGAGGGFGPTGAAGGDLSGTFPDPTVTGLRGRALSATAPSSGQALVWDVASSSWKPAAVVPAADPTTAQPGDVIVSMATTRAGAVLCDGTAYTLSLHPELSALGAACPVLVSAGVLTVPDWRGRGIIGAGTGAGLTARALNGSGGVESYQLQATESGQPGGTFTATDATNGGTYGVGAFNIGAGALGIAQYNAGTLHVVIPAAAAAAAHTNMQPWRAGNIFLKT